jgi:hypothetical protein
MSNPNMPGAGVMNDTLDFVKNLWGSMGVPGIGIPGIAAPTLSVDDLDKKINELRAVESWLNLNATMLRSSIQALEVQRGTIAALKSMGQSLAAAVQQPPGAQHFTTANWPPAAHSTHASNGHAAQAKAQPVAAAPAQEAAKPADKPQATPDAATAAAAQMANPAIWWNLLQDQFKQAVSTAMAAEPAKAAAPAGDKADKAGNDTTDAAASDDVDDTKPPAARKPAAKRPAKPKSGN